MSDFMTRFQAFINENQLFSKDARILLAVSGGLDSVVMAHLFQRAGWHIAIAHCNFKLRGTASDADALFVVELSRELGVPCFSTAFDTQAFAERHNMSIQMAARELRYNWLESLRQLIDYQHIATAHHQNDAIETFLYNFTKGAGIRGLQGLPMRNGCIIRPLLFATKAELAQLAETWGCAYREDASNAEDKYARNNIRLQVVPVLKQLNPALEQTAAANFQYLGDALQLYEWALKQIRQAVLQDTANGWRIDRKQLQQYPAAATLLYEWLHPMGFCADQLTQALQARTGATFQAQSYILLVDRSFFIIEKKAYITENEQFIIHSDVEELLLPVGKLTFEYKTGRPAYLNPDPFVVYLDAETLHFPLMLRHWQPGDYFYPLGLNGKRQKLHRFFINQKIPLTEKGRIWLLTSGQAICWVLGMRADERFKISPDTRAYWVIHFQQL
jgi:tRNA(Ile)-lysidine synthase